MSEFTYWLLMKENVFVAQLNFQDDWLDKFLIWVTLSKQYFLFTIFCKCFTVFVKIIHYHLKFYIMLQVCRKLMCVNRLCVINAGRGVLRCGLDGDVPPAAQNPYPYSGLIFSRNRYLYLGIFQKKYPFLVILEKKNRPKFSKFWYANFRKFGKSDL